MKTITILFIVLIAAYSFSQENILMENQKYKNDYSLQEVKRIKFLPKDKTAQTLKPINISNKINLIDTLHYQFPLAGNSNFGFFGQDWVLQWFKAPADLVIKGLGFYCTDNPNNTPAEVKIVRLNWNESQLIAQQDKHHGHYPAVGSIAGITSFLDNPDRSGSWVAIDTTESEPFEHDIWSVNGIGYTFVPDPTLNDHQWIDTDVLGYEPIINQGEVFGVAVKNTSTVLDSNRIGFFAGQNIGYPFWKFYANGRLIPGVDKGWWTREYTFDFRVAVDICGDCNPPPSFNSITVIPSGTDIGPFTVNANITDANGSNPSLAGVASAKLYWTNDAGVVWHPVPMTGSEPNFSAIIPEQIVNTSVEYYLEATDFQNQIGISTTISFRIFGPSGANTLVILNGFNSAEGYPQDYFFGPDIQSGNFAFAHDTWVYGQPPSDLFDNYANIIEICNGVPDYYLDSLIRPWLAGGSNRNYYLEGQEWLGSRYAYIDTSFIPGNFEFDILGINHVYNDVSYANSTGQNIPSKLLPQQTTLFGQPLLDKFATYTPAPDSIQYNPVYEGNTGDQNWIDGFNIESDVVIDVMTETRGIAGVPNVQNLPCAIHRTLPNGNKVFFAGYWTYAVNTAVNQNLPTYHWLGNTNESCGYQALLWFGITITDVEKVGNEIPKEFSLSQNYPNPFNPSTTISYQIPLGFAASPFSKGGNEGGFVTLKVYDVLGNEVAKLVDEYKPAGSYKVTFDASKLASGVYFYRLQAFPLAGSGQAFTETKKMVLIK